MEINQHFKVKNGSVSASDIISMYLTQNMGCKLISKKVGLSHISVRRALIKAGVYNPGSITMEGKRSRGKGLRLTIAAELRKLASDWKFEWAGVVDEYCDGEGFDRAMLAQTLPADHVRSMTASAVRYHSDIESSRKKARDNARASYSINGSHPKVRMKRFMRNQLKRIKRKVGYRKSCRTTEYFGCSVDELAQYMQANFKPGMHWNNHGTVWEIDHVMPLSSFDLMDYNQRMFANHWTNLMPLYKHENRRKGAKTPEKLQQSSIKFIDERVSYYEKASYGVA